MADKRKALITEAIKDNTAIFTSNDILIVAGIDVKDVTELLNKVNSNTDEIIEEFFKKKNESQK